MLAGGRWKRRSNFTLETGFSQTLGFAYVSHATCSWPLPMPRHAVLATPRHRSSFEPTTPVIEPENSAITAGHLQVPSPHYQTTRRHSLYGTEDRVVLDPGSRIWKVGFSGEGRPRDVFAVGIDDGGLWELANTLDPEEKEEKRRVLEAEVQKHLRYVFHKHVIPSQTLWFFLIQVSIVRY